MNIGQRVGDFQLASSERGRAFHFHALHAMSSCTNSHAMSDYTPGREQTTTSERWVFERPCGRYISKPEQRPASTGSSASTELLHAREAAELNGEHQALHESRRAPSFERMEMTSIDWR
ncbi:hypothetical protein Dimus_038804 [Dionaea muscipula]